MATLSLKNATKSFGNIDVIKGVDLDIADREFVVFVGPSGSGKSTLLRMIAGLEEITGGDLTIDGERINDTPPDERGLAMVFQTYALYPHMNVRDNMGFALKLAGVAKAERDRKVEEVAKTLQLDQLLDRKPKQLSGGQRQRVAIGRAMVREPKIFLFDEPLSNLDAALRVQMRIELARLHDRLNATMIYVTHDQVEVMKPEHPVNRFVAGFIGSPTMNFIEVKASAVDTDGVTVQLANGRSVKAPVKSEGVSAGAPLVLGIRPEHLHPAADGILEGEIMVVERLGGETYLYVQNESATGLIVAEAGGGSAARAHETAKLGFDPTDAHLFTPDGKALERFERHPLLLTEKKTHL